MNQTLRSLSQWWSDRQQRFSRWLRHTLDHWAPPDSVVLVSAGIAVGVGTGLGAVVFVRLLDLIDSLATRARAEMGVVAGLLLVMGASGLVVGFIVDRYAREARGHGVPEVMEAVAIHAGRIRSRVAAVKVLASSLTIGAGGSAGREGPIVQVGSALGSTLGQWLHFSARRTRMMVACGAAAGIAATFNAPIAGSLFALEVILGEFSARYFGAVVVSAVAASVVARIYLSEGAVLTVPPYPLHHLGELPIYFLLGLLAALTAVLFVRLLYGLEDRFHKWRLPAAIKAMVGMLLTAGVALLLPGGASLSLLGSGLPFVGETIAADIPLAVSLMAALLLLKMAATGFTLGSGNSGGVFAPSLFMGAMLGGIVGTVAHGLWPGVAVNPGAYAIVGMAAVFSAAARAPMTAVLIVFEMSNDYQLILPLMLATVLATFTAEHLFAESIYTLKLRRKGITLQRGRDFDLMQSLLVREAMTGDPYVVSLSMPLPELEQYFERTHSHSFPVVDDQLRLVGMVSIGDFDEAMAADPAAAVHMRVEDIATFGQILFAYEDEPLSDALQRLAVRGIGKLPVVSRQDPGRVTGVIRRRDIIRAYNLALSRRAERQASGSAAALEAAEAALAPDGAMMLTEIEITVGSPAVDRSLADMGPLLPHDCVVVLLRRQGTLLIPHGDTIFQPGDYVRVLVNRADNEQLRRCFVAGADATR